MPAGTRATTDGKVVFATVAELVIPPGEMGGEVAAVCTQAGEIGNGFVPGQIARAVDVAPYVAAVANVTLSEGGAAEESDGAFYERMRQSVETFSTAGSVGAYEYYAKSASPLVVDVKAGSPSPGVVDVRVLLEGGALPGEELLKEIAAAISDDRVRPLTDKVEVRPPEQVAYAIDATYYTETGAAQSQEETARRVTEAVEEFTQWQSARMGRDINPSRLVSLLMGAGVKRVEVRAPVFLAVPDTSVAVLTGASVSHGGTEDG